MLRFGCVVLLGAMLATCGSPSSKILQNTSAPAVLAQANKGTVVLYTSLRAEGCNLLYARLARGDESNRYTGSAQLGLSTANTTFVNDSRMPSTITLPPGKYGIVALECEDSYQKRRYVARVAEKKDLLGARDIYDKPLATFEVRAGEIANIGMLSVANAKPRELFSLRPGSFSPAVMSIPEPVLKKFAETFPDMAAGMVQRPMVASNAPSDVH